MNHIGQFFVYNLDIPAEVAKKSQDLVNTEAKKLGTSFLNV